MHDYPLPSSWSSLGLLWFSEFSGFQVLGSDTFELRFLFQVPALFLMTLILNWPFALMPMRNQ